MRDEEKSRLSAALENLLLSHSRDDDDDREACSGLDGSCCSNEAT